MTRVYGLRKRWQAGWLYWTGGAWSYNAGYAKPISRSMADVREYAMYRGIGDAELFEV